MSGIGVARISLEWRMTVMADEILERIGLGAKQGMRAPGGGTLLYNAE